MIPFLLAAAGGYLLGQSGKQDTFADGGNIDEKELDAKVNGTFFTEDGILITLIDEYNIGGKLILDAQKKYIEQRNTLKAGKKVEDLKSLLEKQVSAENLVSQKILPSKYNDYHFAFINSEFYGQPMNKEEAVNLSSRLNKMGYKSIIVPSIIVSFGQNEPSLGKYDVYTDKPVSEKDLKYLGLN